MDDRGLQFDLERVKDSHDNTKLGKRKLEHVSEDKEFLLPSKLAKLEHVNIDTESKGKKHGRKRLKYLLQAVLDQMEFYFSDSNLSKDRYLKKLMEQSPDGYIDLSVFGNFNKLQALHKDGVTLKILGKALGQSKMLQLNENKTRVKRLTPFKEISAEETDHRTVYVEYLPKHANHAWIQTTFAACGKVMYVSLPKFPSTGEIKGFAFVEFQTYEEAEKACSMLNNPPPAKEGDKPGRFPRGNKTLNRLQRIVPPRQDQDSNEENVADELKEEPKRKKKKKSSSKKKQASDASFESEQQVSEIQSGEGMEGKRKKKKKKKKKQGALQEDSFVKDESSVRDESLVKEEVRDEPENISVEEGTVPSEKSIESDREKISSQTSVADAEENLSSKRKKKKKKKKKGARKLSLDGLSESRDMSEDRGEELESETVLAQSQKTDAATSKQDSIKTEITEDSNQPGSGVRCESTQVLGRRERKRLRQEDIRRKKKEREEQELAARKENEDKQSVSAPSSVSSVTENNKEVSKLAGTEKMDSDGEDSRRKSSSGSELTSILKSKGLKTPKKVEFNPVPVTQEFVREKEIRKRKKAKKDKLHLRVISKKEWLSLKAEYLEQQKSHMTALKESLRELRQQENQTLTAKPSSKHLDLEDVFGTKRLKPSQDVKMAHVESLKFTPDVIVQWKSSNEMHRDKIRTMFKDISGDSIAYIDADEEAKTGYIRFKDKDSAQSFANHTRHSNSFSARVLPLAQQQQYWDKANADRMKKLGRKKQEKGSERIARKVFERNKTTFHEKPSRICFKDDSDDEKESENQSQDKQVKELLHKEEKERSDKTPSEEAAST